MSALVPFAAGGYAFREGVFPYSQGVIALPGFAIERAHCRFPRVPRQAAHGAVRGGTALAQALQLRHYCRPPIAEIEFEMDLRGVSVERMLA